MGHDFGEMGVGNESLEFVAEYLRNFFAYCRIDGVFDDKAVPRNVQGGYGVGIGPGAPAEARDKPWSEFIVVETDVKVALEHFCTEISLADIPSAVDILGSRLGLAFWADAELCEFIIHRFGDGGVEGTLFVTQRCFTDDCAEEIGVIVLERQGRDEDAYSYRLPADERDYFVPGRAPVDAVGGSLDGDVFRNGLLVFRRQVLEIGRVFDIEIVPGWIGKLERVLGFAGEYLLLQSPGDPFCQIGSVSHVPDIDEAPRTRSDHAVMLHEPVRSEIREVVKAYLGEGAEARAGSEQRLRPDAHAA